jgi:acetolactate synthase small subunit
LHHPFSLLLQPEDGFLRRVCGLLAAAAITATSRSIRSTTTTGLFSRSASAWRFPLRFNQHTHQFL